jgi:hypothetical protein
MLVFSRRFLYVLSFGMRLNMKFSGYVPAAYLCLFLTPAPSAGVISHETGSEALTPEAPLVSPATSWFVSRLPATISAEPAPYSAPNRCNGNYYVNTAILALPASNSCGQQVGARAAGCEPFVDGDANGDSDVNVGDVAFLINNIFKSGPAPDPIVAGDANCDGDVNAGDPVFLIGYIFKYGPEPGCP